MPGSVRLTLSLLVFLQTDAVSSPSWANSAPCSRHKLGRALASFRDPGEPDGDALGGLATAGGWYCPVLGELPSGVCEA